MMDFVDRFSLLILEPGEIYFCDYAVTYILPCKDEKEKETWEKKWHSARVRGRIKICSKSVVFDPQVKQIPILKFPLKSCMVIQELIEAEEDSGYLQCENPVNVFLVSTNKTVEILENNLLKPYKFCKKQFTHGFELTIIEASEVLPMILQLQRASTLPPNDQNIMIESMVRSLLNRRCFDISLLQDSSEEVVLELPASRLTPMVTNLGRLLISNCALYFQPFNNIDHHPVIRICFKEIKQIIKRRWLLRHVGLEIYCRDKSPNRHIYLLMKECEEREQVYECLLRQSDVKLINSDLRNLVYKWQVGAISNYEYLTLLNSYAARSLNDMTQYPVFPWILSDYTSNEIDLNDPQSYRDLTKPIGALNEERLQKLIDRYDEMDEPKFLYGSHYSTPGFVLFYLVRRHPQLMLCLQNGKFDHPDRMFNSMESSWRNVTTNHCDFKELLPEFYDTDGPDVGDFLCNRKAICFGTRHNGDPVWDVGLPGWAKSPSHFIETLRQALESDYVTSNINHWIDLIFGYKQRGAEAQKSSNVFYPMCYEGSVDVGSITDFTERIAMEVQITEFGQIPKQLFKEAHPILGTFRLYRYINEDENKIESSLKYFKKENGNQIVLPRLFSFVHSLASITKECESAIQRSQISTLTFCPDGKSLLALGHDGCIKTMTLPQLDQIGNLKITSMALSSCIHFPGTSEFLLSSWDNYIYRYNTKLTQMRHGVQTHSDAISCMDLRCGILVTASSDCLVRIWSIEESSPIERDYLGWNSWRPSLDHLWRQIESDAPVTCIALSPNGTRLAWATEDGYVRIEGVKSNQNEQDAQVHEGIVNCIMWNIEGDKLATCGNDGRLVVLDSIDLYCVAEINLDESLRSFAWDGRICLLGGNSGYVIVVDIALGKILWKMKAHEGPCHHICLSSCCSFFATTGDDKKVCLWTLDTKDQFKLTV